MWNIMEVYTARLILSIFLLLVLSTISGMLISLLIAMTRKPKPLLGLSKRRFPRVPKLTLPSSSKDHSMITWLVSLSDS